ncbi:MAG TPA: hypothetical protein VIK20_06480, partial [Bacteroidales bacterium]
MNKLKNILITLIAGVILIFLFQPVINYGFRDFPFILMVLIALWIILNTKEQLFTVVGEQNIRFNFKNIGRVPIILLSILLLYITVFPAISSWALFRSQDYRKLIGQVDVGKNLSNHMLPISLDKIRVVDQELAQLLGDKVLGSQPALGSQVRLGTFNIQKVNNELYWVAPLLHSGFFKWLSNSQGANGYVMVNATNERDVKLVQEVNGKSIYIKYQSEAFLFDNLKRYLYFKGYFFQGLTDYSFEIDDAGIPYWVVTKFKKTIGFSGDEANGVIVLNAQTGEIKEYQIKDAPAWIDRIQPADFVETQLNN